MTISTDELYRSVETATVDRAEELLLARYVEAYGLREGTLRLETFLEGMASNISGDSRPLTPYDVAA